MTKILGKLPGKSNLKYFGFSQGDFADHMDDVKTFKSKMQKGLQKFDPNNPPKDTFENHFLAIESSGKYLCLRYDPDEGGYVDDEDINDWVVNEVLAS